MSDVKCEKKGIKIPTYIPKKAHELPMFFENKPYQGASGKILFLQTIPLMGTWCQ